MKIIEVFSRSRLIKPAPPFSIPADLARQYRGMARAGIIFGIIGLSFGAWEHYQRGVDANRPAPVFVNMLAQDGRLIRTFAADQMDESAVLMAAKAAAAAHVVRMRNVTQPIDFTLAAFDEGAYFVKDTAARKMNGYLGSQPFNDLTQRQARRVVLLDEVIATPQSGSTPDGRFFLIAVQWPERVVINGALVSTVTYGGTVMIERVPEVPQTFADHGNIGFFVTDFDFNTTD